MASSLIHVPGHAHISDGSERGRAKCCPWPHSGSKNAAMNDGSLRARWLQDEEVLGDLGAALSLQLTRVEVRIPRPLADAAVHAWQRDDDGDLDLDGETCEQRVVRHRAGALALIGAAVEDRGRLDGADVVVQLDAWLVGDAMHAADDRDLIQPPQK